MILSFKNIFRRRTKGIAAAAILVGVFSLFSRFLGIFRDRILAGQFGAGQVLDAYYSAFRVPDLIYNLIVLGALSAGFIPIFSRLIKKMKCDDNDYFCFSREENKEAWNLVSNILNVLTLSLLFLSFLGFLLAPFLVSLITPGFSEELKSITVVMTRIMFLSPVFLGISSILGGVLQSFKNFLVFSLAPVFYNLGIIFGAVFFVPLWGVSGLAWGVVLGAFVHMIIQVPPVKSLGFSWRGVVNIYDQNLRKILSMMVPRTLSLAIAQINLLVITIIASTLPSGSLTVFNMANNLQSFPIGVFGISFAVAAFPTLAASAFDQKKLVGNFSYALRQILFFIIPSTVLLITLRAQIIRVILGTGEFSWRDTILTIDSLGFFALSLFAQATIPLLVRVFYARENSKTPFYIGLIVVVFNIFLSLFLGKRMGVAGLALAFSLSSVLNFMILWMWLYFEIGDLDQKKIMISVVKFSLAALVSGVFIQIGKVFVWPFIDMTKFWGVLIQGSVAGLSGLAVYFLLCYLMKTEEMLELIEVVKKKMPFGKKIKKEEISDQSEARGL
ncbi:MAG: murein biosynthesis integral membrane protein MurJ [Patescibacteria group bacterium]|nr:murein biosynthesis integral membrane protein MurJ [Patescibacteria group bacterium]